MALKNINPTKTKAWKKLSDHFSEIKDTHLKEFFKNDANRKNELSLKFNDFHVDLSNNRINQKTIELLIELAKECELEDAIEKYFSGNIINATENRAVLHTALRDFSDKEIRIDGKNVKLEITATLNKIEQFSEKVISGQWKGYTGKSIKDIVNIGIGGSDLGPDMVVEALKFYKNHLNTHFVSNVDGDHVSEVIKNLDPETTLFIIVSKTFTTQETLSNANTIKEWFLQSATEKDISKHFAAVSTNLEAIDQFGIDKENVFPMWNWVGGRFSLWSAVVLSISLSVGYNNFKSETEAILPYSQYLNKLPDYLQQAIMESNGKSVDRNGTKVNYQTGTIIWGSTGTNMQHAFMQLVHQGTKLIPTDFIGFKESLYGLTDHHKKLMANYYGQMEALAFGKTKEEVHLDLKFQNNTDKIATLLPFKVFEGNKPSNAIVIDKLTPNSVGKLIAMYEHKLFTQGVLWNIYSFDQFGVELGKELANNYYNKNK